MKSFNPASQPGSQANIVPFTSSTSSLRVRHAASGTALSTPSVWNRFWNAVVKALTANAEPKIVQKQEPNGNEYYQVYDPVTGSSKTFGSELETRIWLDRRFYESSRNW
jgi:hypothetical protein